MCSSLHTSPLSPNLYLLPRLSNVTLSENPCLPLLPFYSLRASGTLHTCIVNEFSVSRRVLLKYLVVMLWGSEAASLRPISLRQP